MKQRIMSRAEIARVMLNRRERENGNGQREYDRDRERQAMEDLFFYVLADDKSVRIYNDTAMGGTVVEVVE